MTNKNAAEKNLFFIKFRSENGKGQKDFKEEFVCLQALPNMYGTTFPMLNEMPYLVTFLPQKEVLIYNSSKQRRVTHQLSRKWIFSRTWFYFPKIYETVEGVSYDLSCLSGSILKCPTERFRQQPQVLTDRCVLRVVQELPRVPWKIGYRPTNGSTLL